MSDNNKVIQLQNLFPNVDQSVIQGVLEGNDWNVQAAVEPLLVIAADPSNPEEASKSEAEESSNDADLAALQQRIRDLAKETADEKQEEVSDESTPNRVEPTEKELQEEQDAKLAVEIARQEAASSSLGASSFVVLDAEEELAERNEELETLRAELEDKVMNEPGRVEAALAELKSMFSDLKTNVGAKSDVEMQKLMNHLKKALAIIDSTIKSVQQKAKDLGKKVKDQVESWKILETLKDFTANLKAEISGAIETMKAKKASREEPATEKEMVEQATQESQQQELESYLSELDARTEAVVETQQL